MKMFVKLHVSGARYHDKGTPAVLRVVTLLPVNQTA